MVDSFRADTFIAHTKAMELLAHDSWRELDDFERSLLERAGLDRERWAIVFGNRLFQFDIGRRGPPSSPDDAHARRGSFPELELQMLASSFARRASTPGGLSWSELPIQSDVFERETSDRPGRVAGAPGQFAESPFDPVLRRLEFQGDRVQIGRFRLYGALEILALLINVVLRIVFGTFANLWRLFVVRQFDRFVLLKALVGSAILLGAIWLAMSGSRPS